MKANITLIATLALLTLAGCQSSSAPATPAQTPAPAPGGNTSQPGGNDSVTPPAGAVTGKYAPFISAHRGGAAYAPEDTLSAYRNAVRLGVDDFETDTVPTQDGVLILIHDDSVDRTSNCTGKVNSFKFEDIRKCDAGYWWTPGQGTTSQVADAPHPFRGKGVTFPTAQELFDFAKSFQGDYQPTVTIEIKNGPNEAQYEPQCATTAAKLVKMIQTSGIQNRIVVQSFDPTCVDKVKSIDKTVKTLYLAVAGAAANVAYCAAMGHDFSSPPYDTPDFSAQVVAAAHRLGVKVNPYTVDTEAAIKTVIADGVDGLITNYPACMMKIQGRGFPSRLLGLDAGPDIDIPLCGS